MIAMANDHLAEVLARFQTSLRRRLKRDTKLRDPAMRALHHHLQTMDQKQLLQRPLQDSRFVVIDTETTGLKAYAGDEILSISLIELQGLELTDREYNSLVDPGRAIPADSTAIHQITEADVRGAPTITQILTNIVDFIGDGILVGHHINFDIRFLNKILQKEALSRLEHPWIDTMMIYMAASGRVGHYTLEEVARFSRVEILDRHTARGDALATAEVFRKLASQLVEPTAPIAKLIARQYELGHF